MQASLAPWAASLSRRCSAIPRGICSYRPAPAARRHLVTTPAAAASATRCAPPTQRLCGAHVVNAKRGGKHHHQQLFRSQARFDVALRSAATTAATASSDSDDVAAKAAAKTKSGGEAEEENSENDEEDEKDEKDGGRGKNKRDLGEALGEVRALLLDPNRLVRAVAGGAAKVGGGCTGRMQLTQLEVVAVRLVQLVSS
jgi:hypothetical protein